MESVLSLLICVQATVLSTAFGKGLFTDSPHIVHLTKDNFEQKVLKSERVWMVAFYDASNQKSKDAVIEIEKVARILSGIAKIGVVDAAEHDKLAHHYDAKEAPLVLFFAADKEKPTLHREQIEAGPIIKKIGKHLKELVRSREDREPNPKKDVVKITAENFHKKVLDSDGVWFLKFYDPNCAYSRSFAPEYAKAAAVLKGAVHVGAANMDEEPYKILGEPYNIERVPEVRIFGADKVTPAEFKGKRTASDLIDRALEELEAVVRKRMKGESKDDLYGSEEEADVEEESEEEKRIKEGEEEGRVKESEEEKRAKESEEEERVKERDEKERAKERDEEDRTNETKKAKKDDKKKDTKKDKKQGKERKDEL